ncbi:MAG: 30S ribosomal protein S15 [Candidatus Thermoplasmatota archaeon]|nr:30S ribosomal protein S15 [Candidatus Thermoplasmatota archaeon]MCL5789288.1 30S ribosomal protein S15 [Candidatus Thermoplasmatota archaeon]
MARMHTRKRGRAGSKRPVREGKPTWVTMGNEELDKLIVKLKKEGLTKSKLGMVLRDQYGIPKVKEIRGSRISKVLESNGIKDQMPEDLAALVSKAVNLNKHLGTNPKDLKNRRGLELVEAKIKRLSDYYKRKSKLPDGWSYSRATAESIVK